MHQHTPASQACLYPKELQSFVYLNSSSQLHHHLDVQDAKQGAGIEVSYEAVHTWKLNFRIQIFDEQKVTGIL